MAAIRFLLPKTIFPPKWLKARKVKRDRGQSIPLVERGDRETDLGSLQEQPRASFHMFSAIGFQICQPVRRDLPLRTAVQCRCRNLHAFLTSDGDSMIRRVNNDRFGMPDSAFRAAAKEHIGFVRMGMLVPT